MNADDIARLQAAELHEHMPQTIEETREYLDDETFTIKLKQGPLIIFVDYEERAWSLTVPVLHAYDQMSVDSVSVLQTLIARGLEIIKDGV